jgi:hypothetical protein
MLNITFSMRHPKLIWMPLVFGVIYATGIPAFILLWSGKQFIPGFAGFEQYGLLYASTCLFGVISNFAILRDHRWGVIGQIIVWVTNAAINIVLHRNMDPSFGLALLLVGFWVFDVYRSRQLLK